MVKLVAQFRRPPDPEQLLADVLGLVLPRCRRIPGVLHVALASSEDHLGDVELFKGQRGDRRGPPFLTAELYFDDRAAFDDALATPEAEAALGELMDVADRDVHVFLADVRAQDLAAIEEEAIADLQDDGSGDPDDGLTDTPAAAQAADGAPAAEGGQPQPDG